MHFRIILAIPILFLAGCTNTYHKEEAIRSLKVLNSDFSTFFLESGQLPEIKALRLLWSLPGVPLPFPDEKKIFDKPFENYLFENVKGVYLADPSKKDLHKIEESDFVSIRFKTEDLTEARFDLLDYQSENIGSRPDFPVKAVAVLYLGGSKALTINHSATIEDGLIKDLLLKVQGENYTINGKIQRTRTGDSGKFNAVVTISFENQTIMDADFSATVGYSKMGYYFDKISFTSLVFHHSIRGEMDYGRIDPTSGDYTHSFNRNSNIRIYERPMQKKVGDIILGATENGELFDFYVRFRNGDMELLSSFLPFLDKVLNMKV